MSPYAVIVECAGESFSAYIPDLPRCVATGSSVEAVESAISEALRMHIEILESRGEPVLEPTPAAVRLVDVA